MVSVQGRQFKFNQITLLKDDVIGRGSYGSVCKARCDNLTCAAKIMHAVLFNCGDPAIETMIRRFEQECEILSCIKHPNIIQYLGTYRDGGSGLPVLLMELMDESLTHFLERQSEALPLHTQVNLSLDIALAVAYLHSNNIQHRDLSSNNVLLLGEGRAKVTDFGMSRLESVNPRMTPATMCCPGTQHYMPPEALRENRPHYTDKLDVFSFGVLGIQTMTLKFPDPSDRFRTFPVADPMNKKRTIEVQAPVSERERRQNHIRLVRGNPLLDIALICISDECQQRPCASWLCGELEAMRSSDAYRKSMDRGNYRVQYHRLKEELEEQEQTLKKANIDLEELRAKSEHVQEDFQHLLDERDRAIQEKDAIIEAHTEKPSLQMLHWRRVTDAPVKFELWGHTAVVGEIAYFHELYEKEIFEYDTASDHWACLPDGPIESGFTVVAICNLFLTTVGGRGNKDGKLYTYVSKDRKWIEQFPPMGDEYIDAVATSTSASVIVFGTNVTRIEARQMWSRGLCGHVLDLQTLEWTSYLPNHIPQSSYCSLHLFIKDDTIYHGNGHYFGGPDITAFYSCSLDRPSAWNYLCTMPLSYQTPVCFRGNILALGGHTNTGNNTNCHRYEAKSDTWVEIGEMDEARWNCMVAVVGEKMVVVGKCKGRGETSVTSIATAFL